MNNNFALIQGNRFLGAVHAGAVDFAKDVMATQLTAVGVRGPESIYIYALIGVVSAQRPELPPLVPTYREIK